MCPSEECGRHDRDGFWHARLAQKTSMRHLAFVMSEPVEATLDLRGLKCPMPALKTRAALARLAPGSVLVVECTDPLAGIDIPHLLRETGDALEGQERSGALMRFRIRKGRVTPSETGG